MAKTSARKTTTKAKSRTTATKAPAKKAAPAKKTASTAAKSGARTTKTAAKKVTLPEKFTQTTMVAYLAEKHDLSRVQMKEIVENFFDVMEKGAMKGERIPVGKFGKLYVKIKPATKARKGRNPATGEEITIPAKRATKVPKFTFSKTFKEVATKARLPKK